MKKYICLMAVLLLLGNSALGQPLLHTRDSVRAAYRAINDWTEDSPYVLTPSIVPPYAAGELNEASMQDALNYLNFLRWLAYLETPVSLSRIYNYQCQHGAVLLAALDYVDHNAPAARDMDGNFYDSAHIATASSNIAKFNWMRPSILREGVEYFLRDDGDANLPALGHRRWALNPEMAATGFGLANSESGMSYVLMYAHDMGNPSAEWSEVCWPSAGAFPADLMYADLAWSITLNPDEYDLSASLPVVTLTEETAGLSFRFEFATETGDGFCALNSDGYGAGPCLIFRPDFEDTDFIDYQQNQRWQVRVEGLCTREGESVVLEYAVDMISLFVQDVVNVEISRTEAEMRAEETLQLSANVVPSYADDLSITWISTDPAVARVDSQGTVTAVASGRCEIIARSANGREDACALTVS